MRFTDSVILHVFIMPFIEHMPCERMDCSSMNEIAKGAEGSVYKTTYLGKDAVVKVRAPKGYRVPELDHRIRTQRVRSEARLIRGARSAGIRTPMIYDVNLTDCSITMEEIKGRSVKSFLDSHPEESQRICRLIGSNIARLHNARICHGDLTTSNMILTDDDQLCILDFSMGSAPVGVEGMGVDLRLLERGFNSAHPDIKDAYRFIVEAYCEEKTGSEEVMTKVQEIKDRGRYT